MKINRNMESTHTITINDSLQGDNMVNFVTFGTSGIEGDNLADAGPSGPAVSDIMVPVIAMRGTERVISPFFSALGIQFFLNALISFLFGLRDFFSIGRIGSIFVIPPSLLKKPLSISIAVLPKRMIRNRAWPAFVAYGLAFLEIFGAGFFNPAAGTNLSNEWLWSSFRNRDIIATVGEVKQGEFGETLEQSTPSQAAHLKWCGRCNDQTPSESGNGSTSALPQKWVMTWPELHGDMQKRGIKSLRDNKLTTIESRSGTVADNVTNSNALLARLNSKGRIRPIDGGSTILEELSFQTNGTAGWYSGAEALNISPADVISAAQFPIKQCAVAVTITGLEDLQNSGEEQIIDLFDARIDVAESSIKNLVQTGIYSDGTAANGKQITGLQAMVIATPTSGIVGGIDRSIWSFWQNKSYTFATDLGASATASNVQQGFDGLYAATSRGSDTVDLIVADNFMWSLYMASIQNLQRFPASPDLANLGFMTAKYINADVVLDGGIGGAVPTHQSYFLNTNYISLRPHRRRNFVPIGSDRMSTNQDAIVRLIGWAGNLTARGLQFQGYMHA